MARAKELLRSLARGALGFTIEERMSGSHRYRRDFPAGGVAAGEERPLELRARWGHPRLLGFLSPASGEFLTAELEGTLDAGGLCHAAPIQGTLELRYFVDASIRYRFELSGIDGARYRFVGEKREIRPWNLHRTHTLCRGTIARADADAEILSDVSVRFDLGQLPAFLKSFRLG
jgi:hypothetical protein